MTTKTEVSKAYGFGYSAVSMQLLSSLDQPVRNPDGMLREYQEMMEMDETVGGALEFLCYSVIRKMGTYTHPDERIQDLVIKCIERVAGTMEDSRRAILTDALAHGFGVSEFTLAAEAGQWELSSLQSYDPSTVQFKFERGDDNALRVGTIVQKVGGRDIMIPADKCILFRHNAGTNPYGKSRLKRCWRWYAFKRAIPKFWAIGLERFGMPMLVAKSDDPEALAAILENVNSKSFASIGPNDSIEAVAAGGQGGIEGAYSAAVEFCNRMIYRSMFLPALLEGGQSGGSFSLGQVHWRMFDDACLWIAKEFAEMELEQLWRPIIDWNFGPQEDYGDIPVVTSQTMEEQEITSKIFMNAVNAGVVYPEQGDSEWMRERLGFPEMAEGGEPDAWRAKLSQLEGAIPKEPESE